MTCKYFGKITSLISVFRNASLPIDISCESSGNSIFFNQSQKRKALFFMYLSDEGKQIDLSVSLLQNAKESISSSSESCANSIVSIFMQLRAYLQIHLTCFGMKICLIE